MTAQSQLEAYLGEFRQRLKALIVARGAAMLAFAALVVTLLAVYFGIRRAFDPQIVISARVVLLLLSAGIAVGLVALPLRALQAQPRHQGHRAPRAGLQRPPRNLRRHRSRAAGAGHAVLGPARRGRAEVSRAASPSR